MMFYGHVFSFLSLLFLLPLYQCTCVPGGPQCLGACSGETRVLYCSAVIQMPPPCKFNKLFVFCINAAVEFKCPLDCDSQATFRHFHFYCDLPNPLGLEYSSQTNFDRCVFVLRAMHMQSSAKMFIQNLLQVFSVY